MHKVTLRRPFACWCLYPGFVQHASTKAPVLSPLSLPSLSIFCAASKSLFFSKWTAVSMMPLTGASAAMSSGDLKKEEMGPWAQAVKVATTMVPPGLVTRNISSTIRARGVDLSFIACRVSEVLGLKQEEVSTEGKKRRIVEEVGISMPECARQIGVTMSVIAQVLMRQERYTS